MMEEKPRFRILLLNGPNVNMLGFRDPALYGLEDLHTIVTRVQAEGDKFDCYIDARQSNSESELIGWIQQEAEVAYVKAKRRFDFIILNAGGFTHTSVALRGAVEIAARCDLPTVEVHLSDPDERARKKVSERFRATNYLRDVCIETFKGEQGESYLKALRWLVDHHRRDMLIGQAFPASD